MTKLDIGFREFLTQHGMEGEIIDCIEGGWQNYYMRYNLKNVRYANKWLNDTGRYWDVHFKTFVDNITGEPMIDITWAG